MSEADNRHPQQPHPQQPHPEHGWQPLQPGGEYESEATAFVQLPEGFTTEAYGAGYRTPGTDPLAAPGHGYTPPASFPAHPPVPPVPSAGTDPAATGHWTMPFADPSAGYVDHAAGYADPAAQHQDPSAGYHANAPQGTQSWAGEQVHWPVAGSPEAAGGAWTVPAGDDTLEESGEYLVGDDRLTGHGGAAFYQDGGYTGAPYQGDGTAHQGGTGDTGATGHWNFTAGLTATSGGADAGVPAGPGEGGVAGGPYPAPAADPYAQGAAAGGATGHWSLPADALAQWPPAEPAPRQEDAAAGQEGVTEASAPGAAEGWSIPVLEGEQPDTTGEFAVGTGQGGAVDAGAGAGVGAGVAPDAGPGLPGGGHVADGAAVPAGHADHVGHVDHVVYESMAPGEHAANGPVAPAEHVPHEPVASGEPVVHEPVAPAEHAANGSAAPAEFAEHVANGPVAPGEHVPHEPVAPGEHVAYEPAAPAEHGAHEPVAPAEHLANAPAAAVEHAEHAAAAASAAPVAPAEAVDAEPAPAAPQDAPEAAGAAVPDAAEPGLPEAPAADFAEPVPAEPAPAEPVPAESAPVESAAAEPAPAADPSPVEPAAPDTEAAAAHPAPEPEPVAAAPAVPDGHDAHDAHDAHDEHPAVSYVLRVNGADRPVTDAWIGESLLYVLRERLGLAGAKDGCSQGECGACSVQVDGRLVASCLVPAATTAGSEVRTVEGLARDGVPSDVQQALASSGAVQCGFCVPGMAMTVHDLLEGNHAPTELEVRKALCGNLCRCSGYRGVLDAVAEVVEARAEAAEPAAEEEPADTARIPHQAGPSDPMDGASHHQEQQPGGAG
ncbi:2Fe-2S iron-sulfur cluster-binding protein [Streptomyces sp. NPDC093097]|uniref:2Fe-2S iron-sulfur cluster-binding protein n=1 Tax=Streptomyces sp. NPDC093097 TaxID=3366027 RepID=UPI00381AB2B9